MKQKRKIYQDGVLELCSSTGTTTLLNEDGAVLSSKYLKSVSCLESDVKSELPNYLVHACERRDSAASQELNHSKKVTNNCSSKVGQFINTTAPLRNAWHILSVLKKPSPEGNLLLEVPLLEQDLTSQSTDKCHLDLQDKSGIAPLNMSLLNSAQPADDCHEELSAFSSEITGASARQGLKSADS